MKSSEQAPSGDPGEQMHRMRKKRLALAVIALIALGVLIVVIRSRAHAQGHGAPSGAGSNAPENRVVPVVVTPVTQRDIPISLEALGNVAAFNTVTVKSQVEGRLDKIVFREGQEVHRGDLLAQIDPRAFTIQLHQAEATSARDNAQLRNARINLERYTTLRKQSLIPQQQVDDQQATADQAEASVRADQAQIENAKLQLDYARITSPIDGVTGVRQVDQGNIVHVNDTTGIVVITQLDPIAVFFTLPEDDLPRVSQQMSQGPVSVEVFSRDGELNLGKGQVALLDNQINQATATIRLKAIFPNPNRTLWPNQFVKAHLMLTVRKGAVVVPAPVVQRGPQGTFAYVVESDQKVSMRPIVVESTEGDWVLIAKGLSPGEQVVSDGQYQLRPGSRVSPRPAESVPRSASSNDLSVRPSESTPRPTASSPGSVGSGL